jgi:hypothetical protein
MLTFHQALYRTSAGDFHKMVMVGTADDLEQWGSMIIQADNISLNDHFPL